MPVTPVEVTPPTASSPDQLGAQPEPNRDHRKRERRRRFLIGLSASVLVGVVLLAMLRRATPPQTEFPHSASSDPEHVLRLKGTTEAVQARAILVPALSGQQVGALTIIHLARAGTKVKKGDLLAEFDRQAQIRDFVDKQADYEKLVDQVAEERAKEIAARAKDETDLKTAEDNLRKAELEVQKAEIVSRIDAEKNQETLEEANATYDQLRETFDLKRKAAQAAIRILEIQRDRTHQTMLHAQANANLMQIHSPLDGVVVLNTIWKQGTMGEVQKGENPGQTRSGSRTMGGCSDV